MSDSLCIWLREKKCNHQLIHIVNAHQVGGGGCASSSMRKCTRSCFCNMASSPLTPTITNISSHSVCLLQCVTTETLTIGNAPACSTHSMSEQLHLHTAIRFTFTVGCPWVSFSIPSFFIQQFFCLSVALNSNTEECNCNYIYIKLL